MKKVTKIAFIGNSSSGKTTSSLNLLLKMRYWGHRALHYGDAVRGISFPVENLDVSPEARLHILYKQMMKECELMQRPDCDFLICERTSLDWLFYYYWTCENIKQEPSSGVIGIANEHAKSYDYIFLMEDNVPYVQDGFRPKSSNIRDSVSVYYKEIFETLKSKKNVFYIKSPDIGIRMQRVEDIMKDIYGKAY